jgi:ribosomal protein L11 methyltransferase
LWYCYSCILADEGAKLLIPVILTIGVTWSIENAERNNCFEITVYEGDAALLKEKNTVIITNINRNILVNDMHYVVMNPKEATLLLSGFTVETFLIDESVSVQRLTFVKKFENLVDYH